jgi:hypothetical protein
VKLGGIVPKSAKKRQLLVAHPYCCFCGGRVPATSVDHVPPRICFVGRAAPEGFEFPACDRCQNATRLDELAFAMFVRVNDPSNDNYDSNEMRKLYAGVKNNLPHVLPFADISRRTKRRALRSKGLQKPAHVLIEDVPMVGIPAEIDEYVHRYARKLAAALYYREKAKPVGREFVVWTHWATATDRLQMQTVLEVARMSSFKTIASRSNLSFGNRFAYVCDKADHNELFMAVAQFGKGLVLTMLIVDEISARELDSEGWLPFSEMFS